MTVARARGVSPASRSTAGPRRWAASRATLSLTVADMGVVSGDVQARGDGRLTLDVKAGGTVTGTVHDPVGPLTVAGSIGRLLYTDGGAVTVTGAGRLTGVSRSSGGTEAHAQRVGRSEPDRGRHGHGDGRCPGARRAAAG